MSASAEPLRSAAHGSGAVGTPAATEFLLVVSTSPELLARAAARLAGHRRARLRSVSSRDGSLHAALVATPLEFAGARAWLSGFARREGVDPAGWDGHFVLLRDGPDPGAFHIQRDALGVHPLFAASWRELGAAALALSGSAVEAQRVTGLPARAHRVALQRFLATGTVAGRSETLLAGVESLARESTYEISAPDLVPRAVPGARLCTPCADVRDPAQSRAEGLWTALRRSVSMLEGPAAGVALSGGIDSSAVAAALAQVRGRPVDAYTFAIRGAPAAVDERSWASEVAQFIGARHHVVELEPADIPALMRGVAANQDFPFGSPVLLAQAQLFRVAAGHGIRTLLGGHGPDLLCGGADTHLALRLAQRLRAADAWGAARFLPGAGRHAVAGTRGVLRAALRIALTGQVRIERDAPPDPWLAEQCRGGPEAVPGRAIAPWREAAPLQALIDAQLSGSAGCSSLLYERGNATAAGLETAQPALVASLRRFCRDGDDDDLVSAQGQTKALLRLALRGRVPERTLARARRVGFAVPAIEWLTANPAWLDASLRQLRELPAWAGPSYDDARVLLTRRAPDAAAAAFRLWRWLSLLEWARRLDLRFD